MTDRGPAYFVGADLGAVQDYSTACVVERLEAGDGEQVIYKGEPTGVPAIAHIRHLERYPLGTPYPEVAANLVNLCNAKELTTHYPQHRLTPAEDYPPGVAVDATGVGRPVVDLLRQHGLGFTAVSITGGKEARSSRREAYVPKADLISALQVSLQSGWLKIAGELELAETLRSELLNFRVKVNTQTAHESYEHREGENDDLVLAAALACWASGQHARRRHRDDRKLLGRWPGV